MNLNTIIAALTTALTATITTAQPFTYQGYLEDNGAPANGEYDFNIALYDAQAGGTQLGFLDVHENTQVTNGLFTVELDFGPHQFRSTGRYIEIRVRPGDSGAVHDVITPRTPVNPAPFAQHAFTADTLTNPLWEQTPDLDYAAGSGTDRFLINRQYRINPTEYFGVHANTPGFVGMYVSGPANSSPFYGYSVNDVTSAYTYFNSNDDSWNVVGAGLITSLRVTSDNNVEVARDIQAENYNYETPKTRYLSISGNTFFAGSGDPFAVSTGVGGAYITAPNQSGWLVAPVNLPDGAIITRLRAYVTDTAAGDISVRLRRTTHGASSGSTIAIVETQGTPGGVIQLTDDSVSLPNVNNATNAYYLRVYSLNWPGNNTLRVDSVIIEYTVSEAD